MRRGYGQYCPLALATELLAQRWTLLIVSRLLGGCDTFNAIHRGVPRVSPSLLSQRLDELRRAGLVEKFNGSNGRTRYRLTPAGRDLSGIIESMAVWGQHWARDMVNDDLDPAFLAWSMHERINIELMPEGRTVLEFVFSNAPPEGRRFWLVHENGVVEMCLKHPGFESDLVVSSDLRSFVEAWRGIRDMRAEIRTGGVHLEGSAQLRREFPSWLQLHVLAGCPRKRDGSERVLSATKN